MGNASNEENYAASKRLRWVELMLWWRGWVGRQDLSKHFKVSLAQASADLQRYVSLNERAMRYDTRQKCYVAEDGMKCVLHEPNLEHAIQLFFGRRMISDMGAEALGEIVIPIRRLEDSVARLLCRAVLQGLAIEVEYLSVHSHSKRWRVLSPIGFGHDGIRWHARCFDHGDGLWKDFVLGRMERVRALKVAPDGVVPRDEDWHKWVEMVLVPHDGLEEMAKLAVLSDYVVDESGMIRLRVRKALLPYAKRVLGIRDPGVSYLPNLDLFEVNELD